ncbi:MAG: branched-chain amino acid ABC transporter permease [Acidimicrobiia bacterium]|nr:MAG: branched-chain amino acid ABC transporter permease [Acidimicrobiia bacterium]
MIEDRAAGDGLEPRAVKAVTAPKRPATYRWLVVGILLVSLLLLPLSRPVLGSYNYVILLATNTLMWVAMASSWNILGGYTGYISLGHAVFLGVGGYVAAVPLFYYGISPFLTAVIGGLAAMVLGLVAGLITLRTRGSVFIISTIALLYMFLLIFENSDYLGGTAGLPLPVVPLPRDWLKAPFYYAMLLAAVGSIVLTYQVAHSKFGLGLRAIAEDETKAEVAGVPTRFYKILAFALSAFWVGFVGAIWGYSLAFVRPTLFFTVAIAAQMTLMAIIGGRATVAGPVIGGVLIIAINEFSITKFGSSEINIVIIGALLVAVLLFFPLGIVGSLREKGWLPAFLDWD